MTMARRSTGIARHRHALGLKILVLVPLGVLTRVKVSIDFGHREQEDLVGRFRGIVYFIAVLAVVDSKTAGLYVSSEYTVIQPKDPLTVYTLWSLIRSDTARSDLILLSTGIGRTRISWDVLSELKLPVPNLKSIQVIQERMEELAETRKKEAALLEEVSQLVNIDICNSDERALSVLTAFKPPK